MAISAPTTASNPMQTELPLASPVEATAGGVDPWKELVPLAAEAGYPLPNEVVGSVGYGFETPIPVPVTTAGSEE